MRLFSIWLALVLFLTGCSDSKQSKLDQEARKVWLHHYDIVDGVLEGRSVSQGELDSSLSFFAETAGLVVFFDHTPIGDIATERTRGDLERVRHWYESNSSRLYWDEVAHRVGVRAPDDPVGLIWWRHEFTVIQLFSGEKPSAEDVIESQRFFRDLTGVDVPADLAHPVFGAKPTRGTAEALEAIRQWYLKNQSKLRINGTDTLRLVG